MKSYDQKTHVFFETWIYTCKILSLLIDFAVNIPTSIYKLIKTIKYLIFPSEKTKDLKKSLSNMFPVEFDIFKKSLLREGKIAKFFPKKKNIEKIGGSVVALGSIGAGGAYLADSLGVDVGKVASGAIDKLDLYGGTNIKKRSKKKTKRKKHSKKKKKSIKKRKSNRLSKSKRKTKNSRRRQKSMIITSAGSVNQL